MLAKIITDIIVNATLESYYFVEVERTDYINQDENKTEIWACVLDPVTPPGVSCTPLGVSCNPPGMSHRCSQTGWARVTSETARRIFCVHLCVCKVKCPHIPSAWLPVDLTTIQWDSIVTVCLLLTSFCCYFIFFTNNLKMPTSEPTLWVLWNRR